MSRFFAGWRKPGRPGQRPRRDWHAELGLFCVAPSAALEPGDGDHENGWYESSRVLAGGLEVIEGAPDDPPESL